ncbi:MAG TPA: alpha/beta hydrolase-fold protein [Bryobacteraceae bacterium]|nr:alpha/beta hydrolase-fold protein [Bryobacteraceae bacterium]
MASVVTLHQLASIPYAVLAPERAGPLPLCILLLGAGGTRENLTDLQPAFEGWRRDGVFPPAIIAVPSPGMDYYLGWDSFLAAELIPAVRANFGASDVTILAGISGGGYGALKLAFARPEMFAAVAAMQPMLEPGLRESEVGARNRLHHIAGGPPQLVGPSRDAAIWEANNPANRARAHARAIRESGMAIYIDAAGRDFLNAHDGAEFLHRTLWDLDLAHEYHLVRDADHGGPSMRPRMRAMFAWLGAILAPAAAERSAEEAAAAWLQSGMKGTPPAGATTTNAFIQFMRAQFEPLRENAAERDPSVKRRYGVI